MVSMEQDANSGAKSLSAMQFKKGFNKNDPCYLAVTRLETNEGSSKVEVPKVIEQVLDKFKDVMPKELPKKLPPRREVDHTIELETDSKAPEAPYRMPPPELEELRKQLKELMDARYIRSSKSPYGAPLEKCSFGQEEVDFLGHKIKEGGLMMDGAKIKAIQDWEPPTKKAITEEPVLRLPDVTMPFELHTDASDFTIGGVQMQDEHSMAFESRKLNEMERKYTVFVIKTDNIGTIYFQTQKKLSPKQACWQDFLAEFDYQLEYKTGKANVIEQKKSGGFLEPLPTPKGPWESVSMDFITCLPKSKGSGSIIVAVDRFSKYGTFIAAPPDVMTDDMAKLFFKNVVKFELLHEFSSPNEQANREGECTIGALSSSEAMGKSPFELVTGRQPLTSNSLASSYEGSSPVAYKTMKCIEDSYGGMKDLSRRLDVLGKYLIEFNYPKLKIYPVFYVSFPKPYHGDEEDPKRGVSKRAPTSVVTSYDREVKKIFLDRTIQRRGVPSYKEYLIKWHNLPDSEGKRKTYYGSLLTISRDITRMA
ncbi:reverse transcriptase [Tanacetum coccineum]